MGTYKDYFFDFLKYESPIQRKAADKAKYIATKEYFLSMILRTATNAKHELATIFNVSKVFGFISTP